MFKENHAFSGFAVPDLEVAKEFYGAVLGMDCDVTPQGLKLKIANGNDVFVYEKSDFVAATYTILNFPVTDIDATVEALTKKGVVFEKYEGMTDEKGIARGKSMNQGPDIAWFKDPAGNFLSVLTN